MPACGVTVCSFWLTGMRNLYVEHMALRVRWLTIITCSRYRTKCPVQTFLKQNLDSSAAAGREGQRMLISNLPRRSRVGLGSYRKVPLHGGGLSSSTAPYLHTQVKASPSPVCFPGRRNAIKPRFVQEEPTLTELSLD